MNCSKCKDIDLKKMAMIPHLAVLNAEECGWSLTRYHLFFAKMSSAEQKVSNKNLIDDKTGFCPSGHGLMTRAKVEDAGSPFFLEKCSSCDGIWFDNDEWY